MSIGGSKSIFILGTMSHPMIGICGYCVIVELGVMG